MRYLLLTLLTLALTSCSLWPWRSEKTGTCLDDDSCEATDPLTQELIGGTWYCYGADRDQPWDCSQDRDDQKITAIPEEQPLEPEPEDLPGEQFALAAPSIAAPSIAAPTIAADSLDSSVENDTVDTERLEKENNDTAQGKPERVEISFENETIEHQPANPIVNNDSQGTPDHRAPTEVELQALADFSDYPDDSYAVQLIALQSIQEALDFANEYGLATPMMARIRSQGNDWFIIILGIYDTMDEAQAAGADWQSAHDPGSKPWIRPVGPLKQATLSR